MLNEDIFKIIEAIPDIPKNIVGKYYYGKCPCGGKIIAIRSVNNGYLNVKCDKCGFELHMSEVEG